jgi:hypothetical protein
VAIGRDRRAQLTLSDRAVSRRHAEVRLSDRGAVVRDLGSRNGTFLNGRPITGAVVLVAGDRLRLGDSEIELSIERADGVSGASNPGQRGFDLAPHPRRRRSRTAVINAGVLVAVVIIGSVTVWTAVRNRPEIGDDLKPRGTLTFTVAGRRHTTEPVVYAQTPPVGGDHFPLPQTCGVYTEEIRAEAGVHSLEHGAVWITYRPDLGESTVKQLASLAKGQTHVLVSPYDGIPAPVVASAWGRQLRVSRANDPRLRVFLRAYIGGPQAPERGSACQGLGRPT